MTPIEIFRQKFDKMVDNIPASVDSGAGYVIDEVYKILDSLEDKIPEGLEDEYVRFVRTDHHQYQDLIGNGGIDLARHFYELGCRHAAVMYDSIEYERQRTEEAELSGDLEEELENYAKLYPFEDAGSYRNLITLARHFAEWGAKHTEK